jgi:hypothetical protein
MLVQIDEDFEFEWVSDVLKPRPWLCNPMAGWDYHLSLDPHQKKDA